MPTFSWLTQTAAIGALQGRLNQAQFWNAAELWIYISEALRHWNGLCEIWNTDLSIANANGQWINTGTLSTSPRVRTQTDANLYTQMQYMLLEPPTGAGTWGGTCQFNLANLQYSLQKRTQEVIQATACNVAQLASLAVSVGIRRNQLPDTVLEQRRTRFLAITANALGSAAAGSSIISVTSTAGIAPGQLVSGSGIQVGTFVLSASGGYAAISQPTAGILSNAQLQFAQALTLTREDEVSFDSFQPLANQSFGLPQSWSVASEPPLAFDADLLPSVPGTFDILALNAGPTFAPPAASLLGVPDDWSMIPMYGALADVLGMEAESTDRARAAYCLQRYTQGLEMMKQSNWLTNVLINGASADAVALADMDAWATGWQQSNSNLPSVVEAGIDLLAPTPGSGLQVGLTLVGNAPLLDSNNTYVQVSRDDFEAILNYGQALASFKQGGAEFQATLPLLQDFYRAVGARNKRWNNYGLFVDIVKSEGKLQEMAEAR